MLELSNANLLKESIGSLLDSPYFSRFTLDYAKALFAASKVLIDRWDTISRPLREEIVTAMWRTHKYIAGSTSNDIPFEMQHCLAKAIKQWKPNEEILITTALLQEKDFYFIDCDPWTFIAPVLPGVQIPKHKLVQISLPKLYKHSPLLCVPLFHELGHFIDIKDALTRYSLEISKGFLTEAVHLAAHDHRRASRWETRHRMEIFADLFCVSYAGMAGVRFLHEFAMGNSASDSHPSTEFRKRVMVDYLLNRKNPLIELFAAVLVARRLPPLVKRFADIDLSTSFADYRPAHIANDQQLFGVFHHAWSLLAASSKQGCPLWNGRNIIERVRLANDLTEKTIRNHCIKEKWRGATA